MLSPIEILLKELKEKLIFLKKKYVNNKVSFMLGTTASKSAADSPYATPTRFFENEILFGAIVFNQVDAMIIANEIGKDKDINKFYVDVEKKIAIDVLPNYEILKKYIGDFNLIPDDKRPEFGNISGAVSRILDKNKIVPYKANDITVDAVWSFAESFFSELSGKKVFIVGLGNIGSKLALKFVESGCEVSVLGRDHIRDKIVVDALNFIKNRSVLASVTLANSIEFQITNANILMLATNSKSVIKKYHAEFARKCTLVIDVGKENIDYEALEEFSKKNVPVWRADISAYLPVALSQHKSLSDFYSKKFGRQVIFGIGLVSGGYIGQVNDIVVDDFMNPEIAYGVCNGQGGFLNPSSKLYSILMDKFNNEILRK